MRMSSRKTYLVTQLCDIMSKSSLPQKIFNAVIGGLVIGFMIALFSVGC